MKNVVLTVALSSLFYCLLAQPADELAFGSTGASKARTEQIKKLSTPTASELLAKVSLTYETFASLHATVTMTRKNAAATTTQKGETWVKGKMYRIATDDELIVSDGKTNWLHLKKTNSLQISRYMGSSESLFSYPAVLLKKYQLDYVAKLASEKAVGNKTIVRIEMTPFDERAAHEKIVVEIDKNTATVEQLIIHSKDDFVYTIKVESLSTNLPNLAADLFTFDASKIPAKNIIDLR